MTPTPAIEPELPLTESQLLDLMRVPVDASGKCHLDATERTLFMARAVARAAIAAHVARAPATSSVICASCKTPADCRHLGSCDLPSGNPDRVHVARAPVAGTREALSDDQILTIASRAADKCYAFTSRALYVAREVERAHGIPACGQQEKTE